MRNFPPLTDWFRFVADNEIWSWVVVSNWYYEHNDCSFFTLLWKNDADQASFIKEFTKLIARTRCPSQKFILWQDDVFADFINFTETWRTNLNLRLRRIFIKAVFTKWLYKFTNANSWVIIPDLFKWYFWEVFYYLLREKFRWDDIISVNSILPKDNTGEAWLDFTEIRRDDIGYYIIIWEIKTTDHNLNDKGYNDKPNDIIDQLSSRPLETFNEHCVFFEQELSWRDAELDTFLDSLNNYVYNFSDGYKTDRKRFYWVINYSNDKKHHAKLFSSFKSKTVGILHESAITRNVKLVWILNFKDIRDSVWNIIFSNYLQ